MATDIHDPAPFRAMEPRLLIQTYLSYALTARRSSGKDALFDWNRMKVIEGVAKERGVMPQLVAAFQAMKASGWQGLPAEIAREVCKEETPGCPNSSPTAIDTPARLG